MSKPQTLFDKVYASVKSQRPLLVVISCLVNLLLLVTAIYMLQIYDRVLSSGSFDTLVWLTIIALGAIAAYGLLEQSRRIILTRTAGFIDGELNAPVLEKSMQRRLSGADPQAGVRDISAFRGFYQSDAILAFLDAPWSLVFIAFIWLLHPVLGMIAMAGAITLASATLLNDYLTRQRQIEAAAAVGDVNQNAIRYIEGGETISPLGMGPAIFGNWRKRQDDARNTEQTLGERTTTILSFTRALRMALQVMILGSGAYLVLGGEITAGAMIAASIITGRALAPIERLTAAWAKFVSAKAARGRLTELFQSIADEPESIDLPRPEGKVSVEDVSYAPLGSSIPILRNISFEILEPGTCCVVVGPSGAGKSSLCRLFVGAWKPNAGHVRLDGADVFEWDAAKLGPFIGYLPQAVELFPGTVAENIARFSGGTSEDIVAAAKLAGVHDLILRLPHGYETQVTTHAEKISMGQRQRIGLARALFGKPALVVLDEPNSNLDGAGDAALLNAVGELKAAGVTVIIVSHRAEILKAADKVALLRDGTLQKFGDRDEVLKPAPRSAKFAVEPEPKVKTSGLSRRQKIALATPNSKSSDDSKG